MNNKREVGRKIKIKTKAMSNLEPQEVING
jgi:hypothetical protein